MVMGFCLLLLFVVGVDGVDFVDDVDVVVGNGVVDVVVDVVGDVVGVVCDVTGLVDGVVLLFLMTLLWFTSNLVGCVGYDVDGNGVLFVVAICSWC